VQLAANHLTASDFSLALSKQNLVTPSGTEVATRVPRWQQQPGRAELSTARSTVNGATRFCLLSARKGLKP